MIHHPQFLILVMVLRRLRARTIRQAAKVAKDFVNRRVSPKVSPKVEAVRVILHRTGNQIVVTHCEDTTPVVLLVVGLDIGVDIINVRSLVRLCKKARPEKDAGRAKERQHVPSLQQ